MNEKYEARLKEERDEKRRTEEQMARKRALNGRGTLTFNAAKNKWIKSNDFKQTGVSSHEFDAQFKIISMLEDFLTEEERKKKYLYEIEDKLILFLDGISNKIFVCTLLAEEGKVSHLNLDAETYFYLRALHNFVCYVRDFQKEKGNMDILRDFSIKISETSNQLAKLSDRLRMEETK